MIVQTIFLEESKFSLVEGSNDYAYDQQIYESIKHLYSLAPILVSFPSHILASRQHKSVVRNLIKDCNVWAFEGVNPFEEDSILNLLDAGTQVVFSVIPNGDTRLDSQNELHLLEIFSSFPKSRLGLGLSINASTSSEEILGLLSTYIGYIGSILLKFNCDLSDSLIIVDLAKKVSKALGDSVEIYLSLSIPLSSESITSLNSINEHVHIALPPRIKANSTDVVPDYFKSVVSMDCSMEEDIIECFVSTLKTDRPDGLFTTVVVDEYGVCLGLVYSSRESIRIAFFERRGVYFSRNRGIWRKGESSGMGQQLQRIRLDCDGDALRFEVIQRGEPPSFCHRLTRTCWGSDGGLGALERTLRQRKVHAPEGSYSAKLFKNAEFLRAKLLEEVQELVEANTSEEIAAEAADVLFFMTARLVAADVPLSAAFSYLDARSLKITRRPGLAKDWRTVNAEKELAQAKQNETAPPQPPSEL